MKRQLRLLSLFCFLSIVSFAQINDDNSNKMGSIYTTGGFDEEATNRWLKEHAISYKSLPETYKGRDDLPEYLNNSELPYFRPIFSQIDGSCAQASCISYNFTYEIAKMRDIAANVAKNQYPSHFTYNLLNEGYYNTATSCFDGWEIVKTCGCPNIETYGGLAQAPTYWMHGYSNYLEAMSNRVTDVISINVGTEEGLQTLKYWMFDHLDGSDIGGIVNFGAGVSDAFNINPSGIITTWGHTPDHVMTFVGWNDTIKYDYNNDGQFTNDVDINSDGVIDMRDWECGALIMANTWGSGWGNNGFAYVMYKLLAEPASNGGISNSVVYSLYAKENYSPLLCMKVNLQHSSREKFKVIAGISSDVNASEPDYTVEFPIFKFQGGDYPVRGVGNNDPLEFGLDVTPLLNYFNSGGTVKVFFQIAEDDPSDAGEGIIVNYSLIDYTSETPTEIVCSEDNVPIINNSITTLSVIYTVNFDEVGVTTSSLPDAFPLEDYSYQLEAMGGQQPYTWNFKIDYEEEDISTILPITLEDQLTPNDNDDGLALQQIEFDFPFYGKTYNNLYISTNGSVLFKENHDYIWTEAEIKGNELIAVFASDLKIFPAQGDGLWYEGDENSATFLWKTSKYEQPNANIEAALRIFPTGEIQLFYGSDITEDSDWYSGISKGDGSNYYFTSFSNSSSPSNNEAGLVSTPFPTNMEISTGGLLHGIVPTDIQSYDIEFVVTDNYNISKSKTLTFTVDNIGLDKDTLWSNSSIDNFPNPFSNRTSFKYTIDKPTNVYIKIYNQKGELVQDLINQNHSQDTYEIEWNGLDYKSNKLPAGMYIYEFSTDNKRIFKKLIIGN